MKSHTPHGLPHVTSPKFPEYHTPFLPLKDWTRAAIVGGAASIGAAGAVLVLAAGLWQGVRGRGHSRARVARRQGGSGSRRALG